MRARAYLAMGKTASAEKDLRRCLIIEPGSKRVYQMLGELARTSGHRASAQRFKESSKRLNNRKILQLVSMLNQPTAAVEKLPAATAAAGCNLEDKVEPPESHKTTTRMRAIAEGTTPGTKKPVLSRPLRFGAYLVATGALSKVQLRAAMAFHRSTKIRIGAAAVRLGFITEPKVEWAARGFHAERALRNDANDATKE
jgi:hypothetical protein